MCIRDRDIVEEGDSYSAELEGPLHRTIKKVSEDIEHMKFNTAIAAMMAFINKVQDAGHLNKAEFRTLLILLNPFAPHITEEMYQNMGFEGMLNEQAWVSYNPEKCVDSTVEIVVQVNGKIKTKLVLAADASQEAAIAEAKKDEKVITAIAGKQIVKEIVVPGKLVNIVVR